MAANMRPPTASTSGRRRTHPAVHDEIARRPAPEGLDLLDQLVGHALDGLPARLRHVRREGRRAPARVAEALQALVRQAGRGKSASDQAAAETDERTPAERRASMSRALADALAEWDGLPAPSLEAIARAIATCGS
jgi:hypothetical protein